MQRRGHTLVELMLVLTIFALFAGIAVPRMASVLMRSRLDAAFDAVRRDLAYSRARAISTGLRHQVAISPDTGEIVVEPYRPEQAVAGAAAPAGTEVQVTLQDRLPEEIRVLQWSVFPLAGLQGGVATGATQVDGAPLVFYPEGTGDSAQLILEDAAGNRRGLLVDGFTGEIRELTGEELAAR